MADAVGDGKRFTALYYTTFDSDRTSLRSLYRSKSVMTWDGELLKGVEAITAKLTGLPFDKVVHQVTTLDVQPSNLVEDATLVHITGTLIIEDTIPLQYSQTFLLIPDEEGQYILNDVFRFNYDPASSAKQH